MLKFLRWGLALVLVYFFLRIFIYHYELIVYPYSATLREAALQSSTSLLLRGINPYGLEQMPQYTNVYGIVYPLLVMPFAKIWGATLPVHRAVTAMFMFACCALLFVVLRKKKTPLLINASAILILYASMLYPGTSTPCVDPATTGLFFMLLCILLPSFFDYSLKSLLFSALFGIMAFYTKPYFLIGLPIIASFIFLLVSKKKFLQYAGIAFIVFSLSIVAINAIFPCYFANCYFVHNNYADEWVSIERLTFQLKTYTYLHAGILLLMISILIARRQTILSSIQNLKPHISIELYASVCMFVLLVTSLGKHGGATMWYFFQLLSPFFLLVAAQMATSVNSWLILTAPLFSWTLLALTSQLTFDKRLDNWQNVEMLAHNNQNVLCSPLIAPLLIQDNRDILDDGQAEYFLYGARRKGIWSAFPEDQRIYQAMGLYISKLQYLVEHKAFNILIVSGCPPAVEKSIRNTYKNLGSFELYAPQDRKGYAVTIWIPDQSK